MEANLFTSLEWRNIGPHRGGRVVAVAGHPTEQGTFYFGGCAGGVWKTTNGGSHWENITDGFFKTVRCRRAGRLGRRPERHLRRYGRDGDPQQCLPRRRRL